LFLRIGGFVMAKNEISKSNKDNKLKIAFETENALQSTGSDEVKTEVIDEIKQKSSLKLRNICSKLKAFVLPYVSKIKQMGSLIAAAVKNFSSKILYFEKVIFLNLMNLWIVKKVVTWFKSRTRKK
jgi:hypothetical protein